MGDKEGGDPEKKMTKDFLDRWKKIASKYEKEEEKPPKETPEKAPGGPERTADEELDAFLEGLGQKPAAPEPRKEPEGKGVDDLLADFGLEAKGEEEASPPPAAPPPPAAGSGGERRVVDALKKVGLVSGEPGSAQEPAKPPEPGEPAEPPEDEAEEEEEEDSLLLELEALLTDEEPSEAAGGEGEAPRSSEAFEEEDLIAELEVMLEGDEAAEPRAVEGEQAPPAVKREPPAKVEAPKEPAGPAAKREDEEEPVKVEPKVPTPPPVVPAGPPEPPRATAARGARPRAERAGRVNGGRVNGGRVNGGRVNGGRVNGGRVNGGRVNGGRVNGGRVNGGRVNGGRVNGGRVNGGRVNGGRVNGGRVNGGRVNGGRVNGGRVNGGRVNGGRVNGGRGILPATAAQARRARLTQIVVAAAVTIGLFASLVLIVPSGTGPTGPQVDGSLDDWADSGALYYTGTADAGFLPSLDLREYAIRAEGTSGVWFTARAAGDFFVRSGGGSPARGDVLLVLIDVDGSSSTGYAYRDMGADSVVEVTGWSGSMRNAAAKSFGTRLPYDWGGFESTGAVQVAVSGDRVEGLVTGLTGVGEQTRAAFVLRGLPPGGPETTDAPEGAATIGGPGISVVAQPVAGGLLETGAAGPSAQLRLSIDNPSPEEVQVTGLRVTSAYAPLVPPSLITGSVWQDNNGNGAIETSVDTRVAGPDITLTPNTPATMTFSAGPAIAPGGHVNLIVAVDTVPAGVADGTSLILSLASGADVVTTGSPHIGLRTALPPAGLHPGSYVGAPPSPIAVDGIPTDWDAIGGVTDPSGDTPDGSVDITGTKGNASGGTVSFLVSFGDEPLAGALIPAKLPPTQQLPGGGGGGLPGVNPPNPGSDFLFIMFDADNDSSTGFASGGHGYEFALRVDGKGGAPLPASAEVLQWDVLPSPGWVALPIDPEVAFGSRSVEISAQMPVADLTGRNITATAYATSWDGARDNLDGLLLFGNELGSRGGQGPERSVDISVGEQTLWPPGAAIPEFQEVLVPVVGAAVIVLLTRRRATRRAAAAAT